MGALESMEDVLAAAEIHVGFPQERRALAGSLVSRGVLVEEAEALIEHCRATCSPPAAPRVIASILADDAKCASRVADLRVVQEAKKRRNRAFGDAPVKLGPLPGEEPEVWEHDRQCRIAYCRAISDRRPIKEVAAELGVSVTTAKVMVDRGRVLQLGPTLKEDARTVWDTEEEQEARRKKFVRDMLDRRNATL